MEVILQKLLKSEAGFLLVPLPQINLLVEGYCQSYLIQKNS